jgi:hypothetical protein|nr:MAG TPA: hypothetical protein [Caudoviricetes sp.]
MDKFWKLAALLLAFFLGGLCVYTFGPRQENTIVQNNTIREKPVYITGSTTAGSKTEVVYVPKESVTVTNSDGSTSVVREQTDVELNSTQPAVTLKVNGEQMRMSLLPGESKKFEAGKLVLNQSTEANIKLEIPVIDKTRKNAVSYGFNSRSLEEIGYRHRFSKNFGYYVRGEGRLFTGRSELKEGGAGLELYF